MTIGLKGGKWKPLSFSADHNQIRTHQNSWCSVTQNQSTGFESPHTSLFLFTVSQKRFKPAYVLPIWLNPCFEQLGFHILIPANETDCNIKEKKIVIKAGIKMISLTGVAPFVLSKPGNPA